MLKYYQIFECLILAVAAWTYANILTDAGMILEGWKRWINDHLKKEWLTNPLVNCAYCVAGQLALWYYLITYFHKYNLLQHILFVCLTVFFVELINLYGVKTS